MIKPKKKHKISIRQIEFCYEYIARKGNGQKAAEAVGIPQEHARKYASMWLSNPLIRKKIRDLFKTHFRKMGVRAHEVINELSTLGFSNLHDYITRDGKSIVMKTDEEIGDRWAAIKKLTIVERNFPKLEMSETETKIELHDKIKPLEILKKHVMDEGDDDYEQPEMVLGLNVEDFQNKNIAEIARDYSALRKSIRGSK